MLLPLAILGHVLGNKEASRNVAAQAAQATGVNSDIVKQLLPLVATAVMGALSKETTDSPIGGRGQSLDLSSLTGADASPVVGMITSFLDAGNDGSITDDLLNMAKKFLGGFGLNCKLAWDLLDPEVDPYSPDNMIFMGMGPMLGTAAPALEELLCVAAAVREMPYVW